MVEGFGRGEVLVGVVDDGGGERADGWGGLAGGGQGRGRYEGLRGTSSGGMGMGHVRARLEARRSGRWDPSGRSVPAK